MACHIMPKQPEITTEDINKFFEGSDPMEHIVNIEIGYNDAEASIVYINNNGEKRILKQDFKPFVWAKNSACIRMFGGQQGTLRSKMREYGIKVKALYTCTEDNPYPHEKLDNGYKYLWYATKKMSMGKFQKFFYDAGTPLNPKKKENDDVSSQEFMTLSPAEQFMIESGKRYFKGYDHYDDLKRMTFDLETEGLNPKIHHINQIGIRTNKGYEKIITITGNTKEEKDRNEILAIDEFLRIFADEKPDVISGHNSENFDWDFFIVRCDIQGISFQELSAKYLREGIYKQKRPTTLKLGGDVEYFYQTVIKYHNVVDSLHAVRRMMATDSSWEKANLKYSTRYLKINKPNRVYVPGDMIDKTWRITDKVFAFNNTDGDWYRYDPNCDFHLKTIDEFKEEIKHYPTYEQFKQSKIDATDSSGYTTNEDGSDIPILHEEELRDEYDKTYIFDADKAYEKYLKSLKGNANPDSIKVHTMNVMLDGYHLESGKYIVERYLLDDIWEGDKVELALHETDFHLTKIMPIPFMRVCTMGTATQWKTIMLTWAYQHDLAVPRLEKNRKFPGGLSRLLKTGYETNIVKLDYNSLYPSTDITFNYGSATDISGVLLKLLDYVLTQREYYKGLKKKAGNKAEELFNTLKNFEGTSEERSALEEERKQQLAIKVNNDNQQLLLKKLGNSFFGSFGCPSVFPWGDIDAASRTTCTGRQLLRLMIGHFTDLHYRPIVGDSFRGDTPVFIKWKDTQMIDIKPIEQLIDIDSLDIDEEGRERDFTPKPYLVLCRTGWNEVGYIYRHKTSKDIYQVTTDNGSKIHVTEDHSLFNDKKEKIKPSQITSDTKLEQYNDVIYQNKAFKCPLPYLKEMAEQLSNGGILSVPVMILNGDKNSKDKFIEYYEASNEKVELTKTGMAAIAYLKRR